MLFSFPLPHLRNVFCELEIIKTNRSSCTLLFLITKSKLILSKKRNALQIGHSPAQETIPSHSHPHGALLGTGQADRGSLVAWKERGIKMVSKAVLEKDGPELSQSSPWLFWALMHSVETQAEVLRADCLDR